MTFLDKAKLMSHIEREAREWGEEYDAHQILGDIEDMTGVDAVPVIRCRDCKHFKAEEEVWHRNKCYKLLVNDCLIMMKEHGVDPNGWCYKGERR